MERAQVSRQPVSTGDDEAAISNQATMRVRNTAIDS
jgi:hypothetical protein